MAKDLATAPVVGVPAIRPDFVLVALAQLTRTLLQWPVQVAGVAVPVWASAIAFVVVAGFAVWGFRVTRSAA